MARPSESPPHPWQCNERPLFDLLSFTFYLLSSVVGHIGNILVIHGTSRFGAAQVGKDIVFNTSHDFNYDVEAPMKRGDGASVVIIIPCEASYASSLIVTSH